jgi:hypothetical protein
MVPLTAAHIKPNDYVQHQSYLELALLQRSKDSPKKYLGDIVEKIKIIS